MMGQMQAPATRTFGMSAEEEAANAAVDGMTDEEIMAHI